jgi:hypothetical protein
VTLDSRASFAVVTSHPLWSTVRACPSLTGFRSLSSFVETIECPKDVSIDEDAKLEVEHTVNACENKERTSR